MSFEVVEVADTVGVVAPAEADVVLERFERSQPAATATRAARANRGTAEMRDMDSSFVGRRGAVGEAAGAKQKGKPAATAHRPEEVARSS
jgi:hypothetical protein